MSVFLYFLCYSFVGFLIEIAFARLTNSAKQDRKCHLLLPVCPVYGFGALAILALPNTVKENPFLLYLLGGLTATAVEWLLAVFYEKCTATAFWNYRTLPLNLQGRVCLWFSLFWGLLALPLVYAVHPLLARVLARFPAVYAIPLFTFYVTDALVSIHVLRHQGTNGLKWYTRIKPFAAH